MTLTEAAQLQHAAATALVVTNGLTTHEIDTLIQLRDLAEAELSRPDCPADARIPFPHLSQKRFEQRADALATVRIDAARRRDHYHAAFAA
ncbi:hypothetical protein PBI_JACE_58 [Gordonia phage Jace]|uniref:Uncharacterized protein n=1 Tax=Gordonia phage Jace TaxID=2182360 RepID=A0A2U8UJB1_9CAUD|nr:hypothetical protein HOT28_gp58 [Gordonia phage Jace]AWN03678.1 hypothetical protein PBI_JACE_58 [Gordonia phage Jace]